jgi:hypothetical protein
MPKESALSSCIWHLIFIYICDVLIFIACYCGETNNEATAIARKQLHKYATVLELLLSSGPHPTMEVLLEVVFCMWFCSEAIALDRSSSVQLLMQMVCGNHPQ